MLDNPSYKRAWEKKLNFYKSIGYVEGVNLFTTRDGDGGSIDSNEIKEVVDKIKDLVISQPTISRLSGKGKRKKKK